MPYIKKQDRVLYDKEINNVVYRLIAMFLQDPPLSATNRAGHMNYIITSLIKRLYTNFGKKQLCYAEHNEIIGMLECCKQEWHRHMTGPYEDKKILDNGDV